MKSQNIQKIRLVIAIFAAIIYIAGFFSFFYPIKLFDLNFIPLLARNLANFTLLIGFLLFLILIITAILGRVYCSTICPLGLFQELCFLLSKPKKLPLQKNKPFKYFIMVLLFGLLLGGTAAIIHYFDPYTIFCTALSGTLIGIITLIVVALIVKFYGRWFCTNLCPVGTLLGLISRFSYNKIYIKQDACVACGLCAQKCPAGCIDSKNKVINNETCIKCFKCINLCHNKGISYGHQKQKKSSLEFSSTRRRFLIFTTTFATFATAYKFGIKLTANIASKVKTLILPPGAESIQKFANKCLNCNLCVENCPMKIIKKKNKDNPVVHIEFGKNFCAYNCHKCSDICPSGAIKRLRLNEKRKTKIGNAEINRDVCMQCGLCILECPRSAITKQQGDFPIINSNICIGCGACQAVCPVSAIKVQPIDMQKFLPK